MLKLNFLSAIFLFTVFFILPTSGKTESLSSTQLFEQGTKSYLAKDYAKASEFLTQALDKDPNNPVILTNLAFTQFQLGKKPLAVGLLRKALSVDPELGTAKAGLKFVLSQMQIKEVPRKIETYESLRSYLLQPVPLSAYIILSALCLFAAGWILISYGGRRKKALDEEKSPPSFPFIGTFLGLTFIVMTGLMSLKMYDSATVRGTIIIDQVSLQTAPGDNQVTILDLYGGMEVIVVETQGDWAQITYPGSLTGWIKKSSLMMTR